jgi:hypothetical protein
MAHNSERQKDWNISNKTIKLTMRFTYTASMFLILSGSLSVANASPLRSRGAEGHEKVRYSYVFSIFIFSLG